MSIFVQAGTCETVYAQPLRAPAASESTSGSAGGSEPPATPAIPALCLSARPWRLIRLDWVGVYHPRGPAISLADLLALQREHWSQIR